MSKSDEIIYELYINIGISHQRQLIHLCNYTLFNSWLLFYTILYYKNKSNNRIIIFNK